MRKIHIFILITLSFCQYILAQTPSQIKIKGHQSFSSSFSYDGSLLASGGDGDLIIWDVNKEEVLHEIEVGGGIVIKTAFSPDGYFAVTANQDGVVRIFTVEKGLLDRNITAHDAPITSLAFSSDGKYLAVGSADFTVSIWDMWRNMKVGELVGHKAEVSGVDFSPKGDLIATCAYDGRMILWKVDGETYTQELEVKYGSKKDRLRDVTFDPDGKKIAVASDDETIRVIDVENRNISLFLRGHSDVIYDIEYSSDGKYLFSGSFDGTFKAWDTETGDVKMNVKGVTVFCLSTNHAGTHLIVSEGGQSKYLSNYDISSLAIDPPSLMGIFAHVDDDSDYHKPKKIQVVFSKDRPKIDLKQPVLPVDQEFIKTTEPIIRIKGSVFSENQMHHFSINGFEIPIIPDSTENFRYDLKLAYGNNTITIKAIDVYENEREMTFKVQRYVKFAGTTDHFDSGRKGKDYALLICTDSYEDELWSDLGNPIEDGKSIKEKLEQVYGFETEMISNPTRTEVYLKLREYNKKVFADDDQLFIFIAGHGSYDDVFEEGYIVTKDSKMNDEIMESYISHSNLKTMVNNIACDHTFLMMDVCFGGTFDSRIANNADKNRGESEYPKFYYGEPSSVFDDKEDFIKTKLDKISRLFMTSGGKTYVPDDNGKGHSPFCYKFLEALDSKGSKDGILTFLELYSFMEVAKPIPVQGKFGESEFGSDFLFISK